MKRLLVILCWALLFITHNSFAQIDSGFLKKAVTSAETYLTANPVEKVYLHLDRSAYLPGDTVWFKAYTVAGTEHGLSAISSILHVEFLNAKDSMVRRLTVLLGSGLGRGDIPIAANLQPGKYHIRAYTNWMRNASPDYFYDQPVTLTAVQPQKPNKQTKVPAGLDVQFFPEGGSLVGGLRCRVAVKATNKTGLGEAVSGSVVDNDGTEVAVFNTRQMGMASFIITAQPGKKYSAIITAKNNEKFTRPLPEIAEDGFALAVYNNNTDSIGIKVTASEKLFAANKGAAYYLLGQSGGKVLYTTSFNLTNQSFLGRIEKKRFPTGIVQFTLFAKTGEALNERIVLIQHDGDNVKLNITSNKNVYTTRQPVNITIKASDAAGDPLPGSFSASVVSEELDGAENTGNSNIYSGLLLTSEIKGYVENPGYYFTNVNNETRAGLDLLMLTQGYRRFTWKEVIDGSYPVATFFPETSLDIPGHVVMRKSNKAVALPKIKLLSARGSAFAQDTTGDANGRFVIKGLFPDSVMLYKIQATTSGGYDYVDVSLDTLAAFKNWKEPIFSNNLSDTAVLSPYQKQVMQQLKMKLDKRIISLKEVTIMSQRRSPTPPSNADQVLRNLPEDGDGVPLLSRYLSSRLTGITFHMSNDGTLVPYSNRSILRSQQPSPMAIILDGFQIDAFTFATLNVNDVESVEVLRTSGKRDMVTNLANVIVIRSKTGVRLKKATPDGVPFKSYGVYQEKEFYSPVYNASTPMGNAPDLRTTIFWKADVITDKEGNASISFYNADTKGTYRVTVEGIDTEGKLGRQVYIYKVE